jgi:hypothetical protein
MDNRPSQAPVVTSCQNITISFESGSGKPGILVERNETRIGSPKVLARKREALGIRVRI